MGNKLHMANKKFLAFLFVALAFLGSRARAEMYNCDLKTAKKYVAAIERAASNISDGDLASGSRINGTTLARVANQVVAADVSFQVTVTNQDSYGYAKSYSQYLVTLREGTNTCYPASIVFLGNSRNQRSD